MLEQGQINKVKKVAEEFFDKMTIEVSRLEANLSSEESLDVVNLDIKLDEPQILIGQGGQTLFEIQRLLRAVLNKKLHTALGAGKIFYLNLEQAVPSCTSPKENYNEVLSLTHLSRHPQS